MNKSELRQIIKEEIQKINEANYAEELAKKLVKGRKVPKGASDNTILSAAMPIMKQELGLKRARYYMSQDSDFASDLISAVGYYFKGGK